MATGHEKALVRKLRVRSESNPATKIFGPTQYSTEWTARKGEGLKGTRKVKLGFHHYDDEKHKKSEADIKSYMAKRGGNFD